MRLGRKLAEGVAVDREAERLVETREPQDKTAPTLPIVTAAIPEDSAAEKPARV